MTVSHSRPCNDCIQGAAVDDSDTYPLIWCEKCNGTGVLASTPAVSHA